jgi:precorrin isomerase
MPSLINHFLIKPMTGESIEAESLATIDREAPKHNFSVFEWAVARRMIHASADFNLIADIKFHCGAIEAGINALQTGALIYADANMVRHGINVGRLKTVNSSYSINSILCHVADAEVAENSKSTGLPRSLFAIRKAKPNLNGSIVAIGNAPIALLELNRLIMQEGIRPALVIGLPVGFVHVIESKNELLSLTVPAIVLQGRRGGSSLAVATIHALAIIAQEAL